MDPAYEETEKIIKQIERRISKEYAQAIAEVGAEMEDYMRRFYKKDETWQKWVEAAKNDPKEYKSRLEDYKKWLMAQLTVGKRWEEMKETLAEDFHNTNEIARSIARGYMPLVYAVNHDFGTYQMETQAGKDTEYVLMDGLASVINKATPEVMRNIAIGDGMEMGISFSLYDRQTIERLIRDNPDILPPPGDEIKANIAAGKDIRWNKQQIQSVMIQSILQGESVPEIATRLAETVGEKNHNAAIRNARTMATAAQNAGRVDSYKRAEAMGIKVKQQWLAVHDGRTRHSHRQIDYEIRPVGERFSNGCEYPGDPSADASEIYNCRCSLRGLVDGLEPMARKSMPDLVDLGNGQKISYEEWRNSKKSYSNPIDLPEKKAAAIRQSYINQYRRMAAQAKRKNNG